MIYEIVLSLYLLWVCGLRTIRYWRADPIDLAAWLTTLSWALGTLAAAILLLMAVF